MIYGLNVSFPFLESAVKCFCLCSSHASHILLSRVLYIYVLPRDVRMSKYETI